MNTLICSFSHKKCVNNIHIIYQSHLLSISFFLSLFSKYKGGGRGGGGRGGGGMKGGAKVVIEPHRHEGVFIARGKEDALVTLNSTPGVAVYGEKRISVESPPGPDGNAVKVEYRVWNPFRSKCELINIFSLVCISLVSVHAHTCSFEILLSCWIII